jgi:hypothetical protein
MKAFKSGDQVPASGVYLALHTIPHAVPGREMYLEGSRFPDCQICPAVFYRLDSPCLRIASAAEYAATVC